MTIDEVSTAQRKQERLLNLVTFLLHTDGAPTRDEILTQIPQYQGLGPETARTEFMRDKKALGDNGFTVETLNVGASGTSEAFGYRIAPSVGSAELDLSADETAALRRALHLVSLTGDADSFALWKLGGADPLADLPVGEFDAPPVLGELLRAVLLKATVSFRHGGNEHTVEPMGLFMRRARWYLACRFPGGPLRSYRVDRMEASSLRIGDVGSFDPVNHWEPDDLVPSEPWMMGSDEPIDVEVEVRGPLGRWVSSTLHRSVIIEDDDRVVVRLPVSFVPAVRTWVLSFGADATVLGPDAIVGDLVDWLHGIVDPRPRPSRSRATQPHPAVSTPKALKWLRRTMAILRYLSDQNGAEVAVTELAKRFGCTSTDVVDAIYTASVCGVPPFGPDECYEPILSDDESTVSMSPVPWLRPKTSGGLTSAEIIAVTTAGQVLASLSSPADAAIIDEALAKVHRAVGVGDVLHVALDQPPLVGVLRSAVRDRQRVAIDYVATSSRQVSVDRLIDPYAVATDRGRWYVDARDVANDSVRRFRIDRILDVELTDDHFDPPSHWERAPWPPAGAAHVRLRAPKSAAWVADTHPSTVIEHEDAIEIDLPLMDQGWLETLVLQIGPGVEVLSPPEMIGLPRRVATALLDLYV